MRMLAFSQVNVLNEYDDYEGDDERTDDNRTSNSTVT